MPSNLLLVIIEKWAKHTVTILVMHLLLVGVLEGFAIATVSIQSTHIHTHTHGHKNTHTHTHMPIHIQRDEYRTIVENTFKL